MNGPFYGSLVTAAGIALAIRLFIWVIGVAVTRKLIDEHDRPFVESLAPLIGLASVVGILELIGFFLPIAVAAWALVPILAASAASLRGHVTSLRRQALPSVVPAAVALLLGLFPLAVAGRATAIALTNDDATYYVTVADQLRDLAWRTSPGDPEVRFWFSNLMLHGWLWRTGIPNLVASVSILFRIDVMAALGIVTGVLASFIPDSAVALALGLGLSATTRARLWLGLAACVSAAPLFLAYQHLLGQLAAYLLFPLACAATVRVAARSGWRPVATCAVLVGAAIACFADATAVLLMGFLAAPVASRRPVRESVLRLGAVGIATIALFPFTLYRTFLAAYQTVTIRVAEEGSLFPQRGWLPRSILDDWTTLVGVDPWPPWPSPRPATVASGIGMLAGLAAIATLFIAFTGTTRRRPLIVFGVMAAAALGGAEVLLSSRYLVGKSLLLGAAFLVPVCLAGAGLARGIRAGLPAAWLVGCATASAQLLRPTGFHVVDTPDHDRLVTELARLPGGSTIFFDGLGAPTDVVHDEHRAFRAALLAGLLPIQPGLDGGFYRPIDSNAPDAPNPPARVYALQRITSENVSAGHLLASFGPFALREVDLSRSDEWAGAWAPTHGWLAAEREPTGVVFRWGEASTKVQFRSLARAPCARLAGEARTVDQEAPLKMRVEGEPVLLTRVSPVWSEFQTLPIRASEDTTIELSAYDFPSPLVDPARAVALRQVRIVPERTCTSWVERVRRPLLDPPLPEPLETEREYGFRPAPGVACAALVVRIEETTVGRVGVRAGRAVVWTPATGGEVSVTTPVIDVRSTREITVLRDAAPEEPAWTVAGLQVVPSRCEDSGAAGAAQ